MKMMMMQAWTASAVWTRAEIGPVEPRKKSNTLQNLITTMTTICLTREHTHTHTHTYTHTHTHTHTLSQSRRMLLEEQVHCPLPSRILYILPSILFFSLVMLNSFYCVAVLLFLLLLLLYNYYYWYYCYDTLTMLFFIIQLYLSWEAFRNLDCCALAHFNGSALETTYLFETTWK